MKFLLTEFFAGKIKTIRNNKAQKKIGLEISHPNVFTEYWLMAYKIFCATAVVKQINCQLVDNALL